MDQSREIFELKKRIIQFDEVIKMTQNLNSELQKKNENMEIENRTLEEEYNTLKDNYENLKKRFEQLQKELTDVKTTISNKSSMFGWIINNGTKDENTKLKEKLQTLEEELHLKIQENEQIHIEIFEEKQNFNKIISGLESDIEKMKININDKISEVNILNEKNYNLHNLKISIETDLLNITDTLRRTEDKLNAKLSKWKNKKLNFKKHIEEMSITQNNMINVNEYTNKNLNVYNEEFINNHNFENDFVKPYLKFINNFSSTFTNLLINVDSINELLIERFIYIKSNIEYKTEHKGYLFACEKIRFHNFTLQQIIRTLNLFTKQLIKKFESINHENLLNITLIINIILTLMNKAQIFIELITKYFKILLKEERKISFNEVFDSQTRQKINKGLKQSMTFFSSNLNLVLKKVYLLFNYDLNYNLKNIQIISDNTSGLIIKVNKNYIPNYKSNTCIKNFQKFKILESLVNIDIPKLKNTFGELTNNLILKSEVEYKIFEVMKEENKNKYNYPNINLSALKVNNDNIKKALNQTVESMTKFNNIINNECIDLLTIESWEFPHRMFIPYLTIFTKNDNKNKYFEEISKSYLSQEPGVNYEEAVNNKIMLKEMLEKENLLSRDRENYLNKITEYEEDLKRYKEKLIDEKNKNDLLIMEMQNKTDTSSYSIGEVSESCVELEDYLKNQINIADLQCEILSDDVQSGKQRSSFKLTDLSGTKAFPLNSQITQEISVLYHRKMIEKIQRYANKVKAVDYKVLANLHLDEVKTEYENRIDDLSTKYEHKLKLAEKEAKDLALELEEKNNNIRGYTQTIEFLNTELEERVREDKENYEKELSELKLIVEQKTNHIHGYVTTIEVMTEAMNEHEELKKNIKDCQKCKKFI
jgi:hypothetical protein